MLFRSRKILLPAPRHGKSSRGTPRLRRAPRTLHGARRLAPLPAPGKYRCPSSARFVVHRLRSQLWHRPTTFAARKPVAPNTGHARARGEYEFRRPQSCTQRGLRSTRTVHEHSPLQRPHHAYSSKLQDNPALCLPPRRSIKISLLARCLRGMARTSGHPSNQLPHFQHHACSPRVA